MMMVHVLMKARMDAQCICVHVRFTIDSRCVHALQHMVSCDSISIDIVVNI